MALLNRNLLIIFFIGMLPAIALAETEATGDPEPVSIESPNPIEESTVQAPPITYTDNHMVFRGGSIDESPTPTSNSHLGPAIRFGYTREGTYINQPLIRIGGKLPCEEKPCDPNVVWRGALSGKTITLFPRISFHPANPAQLNPLKHFGYIVQYDPQWTIPALEPQLHLLVINQDFVEYVDEVGDVDMKSVQKLTRDPLHGPVFMTLPAKSKLPVAFEESPTRTNVNGFYLFRPDGSIGRFQYKPTILDDPFTWIDGAPRNGQYSFSIVRTCAFRLDIVPPDWLRISDMEIVARTAKGDPLYKLKSSSNSMLQEFYALYKTEFVRRQETGERLTSDSSNPEPAFAIPYDDFIKSVPFLFWKDPFGRLIRLVRKDYLPPALRCEP